MPCKAQARKTCSQGRQPCPTPWHCSGLKTSCGGESVNTSLPVQMYEGPGMATSRWVWSVLLGANVAAFAWNVMACVAALMSAHYWRAAIDVACAVLSSWALQLCLERLDLRMSLRGWVWIGSAIGCPLLYGLAFWLLS